MKVKVKKRSLEELMYTHPFEGEDNNTWKSDKVETMNIKDDNKPYLFDIYERCDHEEEDLKNKLKKEAEEKEAEYFRMLEEIGIKEKEKEESKNPFDPENLGGLEEITLENEEDNTIDWKEKYKSLLKDYTNIYFKFESLERKIKENEDTLEKYKFACEDLVNKLDEKEITTNKLQELFDCKINHVINSIRCYAHNGEDAYKINARYDIYDLIKYVIKYIDFFKA